MEYLFIGGSADGERHNVPQGHSMWRRYERTSLPLADWKKLGATSTRVEVYRREAFDEGRLRYDVFVHDSIQPGRIFETLLKGYRCAS